MKDKEELLSVTPGNPQQLGQDDKPEGETPFPVLPDRDMAGAGGMVSAVDE